MKWMTAVYAVAFSLLVGCSSLVRHDQQSPQFVGVGQSSAVPRASVQTALSDGPGIAALINKNYNEDTRACTEYGNGIARGYYFCTGVLLRTTDNGDFNPWSPSPTALELRASSYSWIRHDLKTTGFFKRAGYILLNPADVLAGAVPGMKYLDVQPNDGSPENPAVQCVYPFDAWTTRTLNRNYFGCNFEGTGLGHPNGGHLWGSCDNSLGFTTASQWDNHFNSIRHDYISQCSWNADNQQGWRNMIQSHNTFVGSVPGLSSYNEVMMYNFGPTFRTDVDAVMQAWVVAFFYDVAKPGSLADAKAFQQKLAAYNKRVPILRIDFNAAPTQRFQFLASDQVAGSYP